MKTLSIQVLTFCFALFLFNSLVLSQPMSRKFLNLPKATTENDFNPNGIPSPVKINLGKALFFDKILSGNKNISCATCHHPMAGTGDGLSLPVGEGGQGLGVTRNTGTDSDSVPERVPRNAPALFNLGATQFVRMFHDGRVEKDPEEPSGFRSPANNDLPLGLENVLAVQAMFPVTSSTEMAGQAGENAIADAAAAGNLAGPGGVWELLAERIRSIPEYVEMFSEAFPQIQSASGITFVDAANAIAAYEADTWRADNSPFDRMLRGEFGAMSASAYMGMLLFYGKARCSSCHSGVFQSDQEFHSISMPQIGPGKGDGEDGYDDFGRERVTGDPFDRYKFRTPSLRNVAVTGPWGHDGAFNSLEAVVMHHLDAVNSLEHYDQSQAVLPSRPDLDGHDWIVHSDPERRFQLAATNECETIRLREKEFRRLIDFLHSLTDPRSLDLRGDVPTSVPSGLPVFD